MALRPCKAPARHRTSASSSTASPNHISRSRPKLDLRRATSASVRTLFSTVLFTTAKYTLAVRTAYFLHLWIGTKTHRCFLTNFERDWMHVA
jgi:hypothetical protein